jgi:hypothetical protein
MKKQGKGAEEAEAREREMLLAVWCQVRLLFVGARDDGSPLSRLPPELVVAIARRAQVRPVCYATRWLDQIREAARKSPDGAIHTWTERSSLGQQQDDPPVRRGYVLEYRAAPRHGQSRSSNAKEQFTVYRWESTEKSFGAIVALSAHTKIVTGDLLPPERWTVARFLGKASYDPHWHLWFRASHWLTLVPGRVQHDEEEEDTRPQ